MKTNVTPQHNSSVEAMEKVDSILKDYEHKFLKPNVFHATLHEILIDQRYKDRTVCFVSAYDNTGLVLGIAEKDEAGYIPTMDTFVSGHYDHAVRVINDLNKLVFGLEPKEASMIVISSLRKQ